jgi:hypothetical protein
VDHYMNDSATAEWLLESANLEHDATGVTIEYSNGKWTIAGVVVVDSEDSVLELLGVAA